MFSYKYEIKILINCYYINAINRNKQFCSLQDWFLIITHKLSHVSR